MPKGVRSGVAHLLKLALGQHPLVLRRNVAAVTSRWRRCVPSDRLKEQSINQFVYSPSDTERAVTAKLKRNNAIYSVDVFTLIVTLVRLARRQRIDRAVIESITSNRYNY